ncbi:MAG: bifunctional 4-hydroxy-3-methylbut-2-enyl diphosphate reductase/30S ribosomal protein S1 [Clostridia bacterium]|nr:bifunctional 4-hydroxy-3-methylbut-2-enyl diphosphate reductase/30S ribosomal protein S1 [Clostridia bacterium]
MKITLAKTAGFCFGVNRAVDIVEKLAELGEKVCTLGPIIHNAQLVAELEKKGVRIINSPNEAASDEVLVIRSHGVTAAVEEDCEKFAKRVENATCPFVSKIHKIVNERSLMGDIILIAGDEKHKEVEGIRGHVKGESYVFGDEAELEKILKNHPEFCQKSISVVSQTTFHKEIWEKSEKILKKVCTNAIIFDTICNATSKRQTEASELSKISDVMFVVGGRHSSNTNKLFSICSENCNATYLIETADEVKREQLIGAESIGVVAGASTPAGIIKEVISVMTETIKTTDELNIGAEISDDMSFEEALELSLSSLNTDQKVHGVVLAVGPTEIQVDIGRKQTGYVKAEEFSYDTSVKLNEVVKVGDELDLIVMKTNDQEGTIMLSKRRYDNIANWDKIVEACENGTVLEGKVTEIIKGGMIVNALGFKVFIPASQATLTRGADLEPLKGTTVSFKVLEIGRRRRVIGSVRAILQEQRKEIEAKFWENIAVGDVFKGVVKSLTGYGAFVDLGGVDGMVHISELSWQRIKNPAEVVSVGDTLEVYVKDIDTEKKKISLGHKKPDENPWLIFTRDYADKEVVKATIVSMTAYGAFARIIPGVDGLIHISQIADRRIEKPQDELKIGQEVDVKIIGVDEEKKRVSLSIRALLEPAKEEVAEEAAPATEEAVEAPAEEAAE